MTNHIEFILENFHVKIIEKVKFYVVTLLESFYQTTCIETLYSQLAMQLTYIKWMLGSKVTSETYMN